VTITAPAKPLPPLPEAAKRLRALPLKLDASAVAPATEGTKPAAARVKLVCRTSEPVDLGYAKLVHDMSSFRPQDVTALDYCHDDDEIIGNCSNYAVVNGSVECDAVVESLAPGDMASQIIDRMGSNVAPVPYQSSVHWKGSVSYLMEGTQTVNGQTIEAPAYIVSDWTIAQMAICPQGADSSTSAELLARLSAAAIAEASPPVVAEASTDEQAAEQAEAAAIIAEETADPNDTAEFTPTEHAETAPASESPATPPTPAGAEMLSRAELARFSKRFGADAIEYLAAGDSYEVALEKHLDKLSADLQTTKATAGELEKKLAKPPVVANRGEASPVSSTPGVKLAADRYAHLGPFAAAAQSERFMPKHLRSNRN